MRILPALVLLVTASGALEPGWEDVRDPRGGILGVGGIEFRRIDRVVVKSPRLTLVGMASIDTYCHHADCPNGRRYYDKVTLVVDTYKHGFRIGPRQDKKAEWGRWTMTKSLDACGRLAKKTQAFDGDYIQVGIMNAHDYTTTVFQRSAAEARVEFRRTLELNRGDGLDCSVSFIDKGKGDANAMAWPPVLPKGEVLPPY